MDENETEQALSHKKIMTDLTESPGWKMLAKILQEQITIRTNAVMLAPVGDGVGSVYQQEFIKGECTGIRTVLELPRTLIENAEKIEVSDVHGNADADNYD